MTTSVLPWLPDRHLGVVATLAHADELISQISELVFDYVARSGEVFTIREEPNGLVSNAVVEQIAPMPRSLPLLAADAMVDLRAAIEHTLFTEVRFLNGGTLSDDQARTIEMPARNTHDDFAKWAKKLAKSKQTPSAIAQGSELFRRIEGLQPLHEAIRPDLHPLALLALHTNHAKHRTPADVAVRLAAIVDENHPPRSSNDFKSGPEAPVRVGDVIAQTPLGERVSVSLFPGIGINRPGTEDWPFLMDELDQISRWVREQAIPRLITGGDPPPEKIPAGYEIKRGHDDEREAIGLGTSVTANEKASRRFGAESARPSLVDLLLPTSSNLTRETLTAWVDQLDDDAVTERVERLKGFVTDSASMFENHKVVADLRDEALQFASKCRG